MNEISPSVELMQQVEDVGGAAQPLLQVSGLTKHFPVRGDLFSARKTVRAVDDVSFSIAKGETVGIVGESGCGKSTTARLLMHLMKRDAGDIVYATGLISVSMILAAGLSFLGLGTKPPEPEWGLMLNTLRTAIYTQPWVAALPGLFIFITSISFNMLSDGLRSAMEVKQ